MPAGNQQHRLGARGDALNINGTEVHDFGGHPHVVCKYCRKLVRLDKPLIGSVHICVTEAERLQHDGAEMLFDINPGNPNRRR